MTDEKIVAIIKDVVQISPDDWELRAITKVCDRNTTLGDIEDWVSQHFRGVQKSKLVGVTFSYPE